MLAEWFLCAGRVLEAPALPAPSIWWGEAEAQSPASAVPGPRPWSFPAPALSQPPGREGGASNRAELLNPSRSEVHVSLSSTSCHPLHLVSWKWGRFSFAGADGCHFLDSSYTWSSVVKSAMDQTRHTHVLSDQVFRVKQLKPREVK